MKSMQDKSTQEWSKKTRYLLTPYSGKEVAQLTLDLIKMYHGHKNIFSK